MKRFFAGRDLHPSCEQLSEYDDRITALSDLVTLSRSAVIRDPRSRQVIMPHAPELPARVTKGLFTLMCGLVAVGCSPACAYECIQSVGMDSIPRVRKLVLDELIRSNCTQTQLRFETKIPSTTIEHALQDLELHGVVEKFQDKFWQLTETAYQLAGEAEL